MAPLLAGRGSCFDSSASRTPPDRREDAGKKAVVVLSGGLDSTTAVAVARSQGFAAYALSVDYGQRHRVELERAERIAKALGAVEHRTVQLDLRAIGGSALTGAIDVPKGRSAEEMG